VSFYGTRRWRTLPLRAQASVWRAAARGYRRDGRTLEYERAARTAAIIERRPWRVDRGLA
jgi:hypothetical protein